jgi:hypothetical protein
LKLSWWKRQVLSFLFRQWRSAQRRQSTKAATLMTYASQLGQLDWAIKCVQSDPDALWTQDHNGLSHPVNHRTAAPPNAAPTAPNAPFASAPNQPLSDAMQSPSDAAKHSNDERN